MAEKYGKEELELISNVLDNFTKVQKISNKSTILYTTPMVKKGSDGDPTYSNYIMFGLYKILQDNFDEEFIKEKMKNE